jgi:hypothetical protein
MKIAFAALGIAAAGIAVGLVVPTAMVHADTGYTLVINGQVVPKDVTGNSITCGLGIPPSGVPGQPPGTGIYNIVGGNGTTPAADLTNTTPPQVISINLIDGKGNDYLLNPTSTNNTGGGDVQITKNGNSFKMVGHIALYMNAQQQIQQNATPVPFEFDVNCPQIIGS